MAFSHIFREILVFRFCDFVCVCERMSTEALTSVSYSSVGKPDGVEVFYFSDVSAVVLREKGCVYV